MLSSAPTSLTRLERAREKARKARESEQLLVCPQFVFRRRRFVLLSASLRVIVICWCWQESTAEAEKSELIASIWRKNNGSVGSGEVASGTLHSAKALDIPMFSLVDASRVR